MRVVMFHNSHAKVIFLLYLLGVNFEDCWWSVLTVWIEIRPHKKWGLNWDPNCLPLRSYTCTSKNYWWKQMNFCIFGRNKKSLPWVTYMTHCTITGEGHWRRNVRDNDGDQYRSPCNLGAHETRGIHLLTPESGFYRLFSLFRFYTPCC